MLSYVHLSRSLALGGGHCTRTSSLFFLPAARRSIRPSMRSASCTAASSSTTFALFRYTPPPLMSLHGQEQVALPQSQIEGMRARGVAYHAATTHLRAAPLLACSLVVTISSATVTPTTWHKDKLKLHFTQHSANNVLGSRNHAPHLMPAQCCGGCIPCHCFQCGCIQCSRCPWPQGLQL